MDFSNVTAMSFSGYQATEAWLAGTKVWGSTPSTTTYYFSFRLITNGNYMTWSQFINTTWDAIYLSSEDYLEQISFNKNEVGHVKDTNDKVVFYLSTSGSMFSNGGYVYLTNYYYEYTNGNLQIPSRNSTSTALALVANNISGYSITAEEVLLSINDGTYSYPDLMLLNSETLSWEIQSTVDPSIIFTGTNVMYSGAISNIPWGNDTSYCSIPVQYWGTYMVLSYTLWSTVPNSSQPFTGTISVYIPDATGQGSVSVQAQAPNITDSQHI